MSFDSFLKTFDKIEPLSNLQLVDLCKQFKLRNFNGVFMRDELNNKVEANNDECLILNIDHSNNNGSHWTCIFISDGDCYYLIALDFHLQ